MKTNNKINMELQLIENALNAAFLKGIYTLEDAKMIIKALDVLSNKVIDTLEDESIDTLEEQRRDDA